MNASQPPTTPQPGWYDDPGDSRVFRYWDGVGWSVHTAPKPPPGSGQPSPPAKPPWWRRRWAIATAVVLVLIFGGAALSDGDEPPKADAADGASSVADDDAAEPSPDVDVREAKPTPPKSTVPRVSGLAGKHARNAGGLRGGRAHRIFRTRGPVTSTDRGLSCVSLQGRGYLHP